MMMLVVLIGAQDWLVSLVVPSFIVFGVEYAMLIVLLGYFWAERRQVPKLLWVYLLIVAIGIIRGFALAEGYGDYRALAIYTLAYLTPLFIVYASSPARFQRMSRLALICIPFWLFITYPLIGYDYVARLLSIVPFFLIFLGEYRTLDKFYIIGLLLVFSLVIMSSARAAFTRFMISAVLALVLSFLPRLCNRAILGVVTIGVFVAPFVLFTLAAFYGINILEQQEQKYGGEYVVEIDTEHVQFKDMAGDTRTFIYEEAARSAIINDYIWMGHSLSRGYASASFGDEDVVSKARGERSSSEVHVVNIFTHMGVVGFVAFALLLLFGALKAVFKGQSPEVRVLGFWIVCRWALCWFEERTAFDIGQIYLWAAIAICYSERFLKMDREEFKEFIRGCFYTFQVGEEGKHRTIGQ